MSVTGLASMANPVGAGLAVAQTVMGTIQAISGANNAKRALAQRRAYKTPDEMYKVLQATQSRASEGLGAETMNYLTGQIDRGFAETAGVAKRLGGDANDLGALFAQRIQGIMKVGNDNHLANTKAYSAYLGQLSAIGDSKTAEWKSREDMTKDLQQQANADKQAGLQNIIGGANAFLGVASADGVSQLYGDRTQAMAGGVQPQMAGTMRGMTNSVSSPFAGSGMAGTFNMPPLAGQVPAQGLVVPTMPMLKK